MLTGGLTVAVAELALAGLGWWWWAAINAAGAVVGLVAVRTWKSKGGGRGILAALLAGRRGTATARPGRVAGGRPGGGLRRLLAGGLTSGGSRRGGGRSTGGTGGGRGGALRRLLSGGTRGGTSATGTRRGGGGLLGRARQALGRGGRLGRMATGAGRLLGGRRGGRGGPSSSGGGRRGGVASRATKAVRGLHTDRARRAPGAGLGRGARRSSRALRALGMIPGLVSGKPTTATKSGEPTGKVVSLTKTARKVTPAGRVGDDIPTPTPATSSPDPAPPTPAPRTRHTERRPTMALPLRVCAEETRAAMAAYAPASLQRWGRDLSQMQDALSDVAESVRMVARHGEDELPAHQRVIDHIHEVEAAIRRAAELAGELPAAYRQAHEADEERLDSPRKSIGHERRADVGVASDEI